MAKIKKRRLHWKASQSAQVVGYKLYWSDGGQVDYNAPSAVLGNVTEVLLPDGVDGFSPGQGPVEFGITAMDELGNESDMITFSAAYQFNVPQAPQELTMEALDEFHATGAETAEPDAIEAEAAEAEAEEPEAVEAEAVEPEAESQSGPAPLYETGVYCLDERRPQVDVDQQQSDLEEEVPLKYYGQPDPD